MLTAGNDGIIPQATNANSHEGFVVAVAFFSLTLFLFKTDLSNNNNNNNNFIKWKMIHDLENI